jgi:lipopolysaccharide biosynthesis protein
MSEVRALAFYLPQFHPIPENDDHWGAGFTEWTNVAKARPLFRGHKQPNLPGELGFYDLRVPETREAQAELARQHGIEGFIYWHYWFAGHRVLERPFQEVLQSGRPDFPFCIAWANQSWTGIWHGAPDRVLIEQTYPGKEDFRLHFEALLPALEDPRYLRVEDKPIVIVYRPTELPDARVLADEWRQAADRAGLPGLHLVGVDVAGELGDPRESDFDAAILSRLARMYHLTDRYPLVRARYVLHRSGLGRKIDPFRRRPLGIFAYSDVAELLVPDSKPQWEAYPCVIPNWDNTPRSGFDGTVLTDPSPEAFERHVEHATDFVRDLPKQRRIIVVKSWNEWAEGNHLEPDLREGHAWLRALRDGLS